MKRKKPFNILLVYFTQTGQTERVVRSLCQPLIDHPDINVHMERLMPERPIPFPWRFRDLVNVFPESVWLDPPALKPLGIAASFDFDLIIVGYSVWFLAPSLPVTSFLRDERSRRFLAGKPIITIVSCRNMWLKAQGTMKELIRSAGGNLIDHVALIDRYPGLGSFVSTPHWLMTGNPDSLWGLFPRAGIAESEIAGAARFGMAIRDAVRADAPIGDQSLLHGLGAVKVKPEMIVAETLGHRSLRMWGGLARRAQRLSGVLRRAVLAVYVAVFVLMVGVIMPLGLLVFYLLRPLLIRALNDARERHEAPSGSDDGRNRQFSLPYKSEHDATKSAPDSE